MKEKEIEFKRRTGNGQTWCKSCEKKGRWGLNWDSIMYDGLRALDLAIEKVEEEK